MPITLLAAMNATVNARTLVQSDCAVPGLLSHTNPVSSVQVEEQPSPSTSLPSSHCSMRTVIPSPQIGVHIYALGSRV